jgi:predicted phosphodiesterase
MKVGKKVLFISDTHGNSGWEQLVKDGLKHFYKIVFLGDYVDSFDISHGAQLYNLNAICALARKKPEEVTLLMGNHDYAYYQHFDDISGKQYMYAHEYEKMFKDNIDLFKIAWGYTNEKTKKYTLATHAGLTNNYYKFFIQQTEYKDLPIHEALNKMKDARDLLWAVGPARGGRGTPGPLWADYTEVLDDPYLGINQVFGHTPQLSPRLDHFGDDFIACIDNWGNKKIVSMIICL